MTLPNGRENARPWLEQRYRAPFAQANYRNEISRPSEESVTSQFSKLPLYH